MKKVQLTEKQEKFCREYLRTGNKTEAYKEAYTTENMKPETINRKAVGLFENGKIRARVNNLQSALLERVNITIEGQLFDLEKIKKAAYESGKYSDAVQAVREQNKMLGFHQRNSNDLEINNIIITIPDNGRNKGN